MFGFRVRNAFAADGRVLESNDALFLVNSCSRVIPVAWLYIYPAFPYTYQKQEKELVG